MKLGTNLAFPVGKQKDLAPVRMLQERWGPVSLTRNTSHNTELKDRAVQGREGDLSEARKPRRNESKAAAKSGWLYLDGIDDCYSSDHGVEHNRISGHCWDP